jgi:hypothetical protein
MDGANPKGRDAMRASLESLRRQPDAPDLTGAILGQVDRKRGWLSRSQRRLLQAGRWAAAAVVLLAIAGVFLVQRFTPVGPPETAPSPLSQLVPAVSDETATVLSRVQSITTGAEEFVATSVANVRETVEVQTPCSGSVAITTPQASTRWISCGFCDPGLQPDPLHPDALRLGLPQK